MTNYIKISYPLRKGWYCSYSRWSPHNPIQGSGWKHEDERHIREGLTVEELELFDLLKKEDLTKKEEQAVKLSAKKLYETILDAFPPEFYNKEIFNIKTDIVFAHIME